VGPRAGLDGRKISPPTGIRSRTVQPVAQSLYRLSYPAHGMYSTAVCFPGRISVIIDTHQKYLRTFTDILPPINNSCFSSYSNDVLSVVSTPVQGSNLCPNEQFLLNQFVSRLPRNKPQKCASNYATTNSFHALSILPFTNYSNALHRVSCLFYLFIVCVS